ncbi:MAG: permease, partial [Phycisphaerales bacterium]|nr:permease [Phycisphaerales bacterium]
VKASLLGIPLPLCSCSVIPIAAGLRGSGASKGASAAFAISTPQTGEESIPLTWALFGPVYALARPVVAVATAFVAGVLIDRFVSDETAANRREESPSHSCCSIPPAAVKKPCCHEPPSEASSCCGPKPRVGNSAVSSCCEPERPAAGEADTCCAENTTEQSCCAQSNGSPGQGFAAKGGEVLRYGFGTLLRDLAPWLASGLLLSALIAAAVPVGWIESNIGTGFVPMLLMLVVGLPLYVCATSTTPLAYTLVVAGLSPGAAMVLLLAGPATNAATMSWVVKDLGVRALVIYLATIAVFAVAGGWAFDALLGGTIRLAEQGVAMDHSALSLVQGGGAGAFVVLLVLALVERYQPGIQRGSAKGINGSP